MSAVLIKILNMSLAGGVVILIALPLRLAFRRAPKWIALMLWGIVALRLVLPFSIESGAGVLPSGGMIKEAAVASLTAHSGEALPVTTPAPQGGASQVGGNDAAAPSETEKAPTGAAATEPALSTSAPERTEQAPVPAVSGSTDDGGGFPWAEAAFALWLAGAAGMAAYALISYFMLKRKLATAVLGDGVYMSEYVDTPFLLGVFRPRIYVPFGLDGESLSHVLAHERAHMRALDQLWKPLGFAVLGLHWFNPLCWLAYALFCRDLELACDERAAKGLSEGERQAYCRTVLELSAQKRRVAACPLAFGEAGAKARIRNLLNYKKPAFWVLIAALVCAAVLAVCFLTGRGEKPSVITPTEGFRIAEENGWVAVDGSKRFVTGEEKWNGFLAKTEAKEPAEVMLVTEREYAIAEGKYKDIEDGYGSLLAMFTKLAFDGEKYTISISYVWPLDYEPEAVFLDLYRYERTAISDLPQPAYYTQYVLSNEDRTAADARHSENPLMWAEGVYCPLLMIADEAQTAEPTASPGPAPSLTASPRAGVEFTSPAIEAQVRDLLGLAAGEPITEKGLSGLTYAIFSGAEITDLSDIGLLKQLTSLSLTSAPNADFDTLPQLPKLEELNIWACGLDDVSFVLRYPQLVRLDLSDNEITDLSPISELSGLKLLFAENNRISDITPLLSMRGLSYVYLSWNPVPQEQADELTEFIIKYGDKAYGVGVSYFTGDQTKLARWPMDLDGDGREEVFCVDLYWLENDFVSYAWLESAEGRRLSDRMNCGTGHVAYTTFALVESPEFGSCIMQINPEYRGQYYGFTLWDLKDDYLRSVYREEAYNYDEEGDEPVDADYAADYEARVNALLESGRVLITTDRMGVMEGELYNKRTGARIMIEKSETESVISCAGSVGPGMDAMRNELEHQLFVDDEVGYRFVFEPQSGIGEKQVFSLSGLGIEGVCSFVLPEGYETRTEKGDETFAYTVISDGNGGYIYDPGSKLVGAFRWAAYSAPAGEDDPNIVYAEFRMSHWSIMPEELYEPISSVTCYAALTVSSGVDMKPDLPMAECEHRLCDAIVANSDYAGAILELVFDKDLFTHEELVNIARTVRLSGPDGGE